MSVPLLLRKESHACLAFLCLSCRKHTQICGPGPKVRRSDPEALKQPHPDDVCEHFNLLCRRITSPALLDLTL